MGARVGALVDQAGGAEAEQAAVRGGADLEVAPGLARVVQRDEVLVPVLDPLDRAPRPHGQPGHEEVLGVELAAGAEAAADVGLDEPHRVLGEVEEAGQQGAVEVLDLGRAPYRQPAAVGVDLGQQAARLQRDRGVALHAQPVAHDDVGLVQQRLGVAAPARAQRVDHVAVGRLGVQRGRAGLGRGGPVEQRRRRLDLDLDLTGRVLGRVGVLGQHDGHRLAHVAHGVAGQRPLRDRLGLLRGHHPHGDADVGDVGGGDHRDHTRAPARRLGAYGHEPPERRRRCAPAARSAGTRGPGRPRSSRRR